VKSFLFIVTKSGWFLQDIYRVLETVVYKLTKYYLFAIIEHIIYHSLHTRTKVADRQELDI